MSTAIRRRALPLGLTLVSFAVALAQSPGRLSFETKVDLHVDPTRFLSSVVSVWSPTGDLGHVQSGQYVGYLFPMGPVFAAGKLLGLSPWLVDRLWLGAVLSLAAWGAVRLLDALLARPRGMEHLVAGLAYVLNPYVVTLSNRTTVYLAAYAALPWLLFAVHRGLRDPRGWCWPAAFALIAASSGGGVNAATLGWVLVGPTLLFVYEVWLSGIELRAAAGFAWRVVLASLAAALWWLGGVLIGALYGANFLPFIEQPGTIWATTSVTEVLRGMGYWVSYIGVGFAGRPLPLLSSAPTMLFSRPVLLSSLLVPGLALAGFTWSRRWRYGPFFLALTLVGALIVVAGFPEGTPLRRGLHFVYNRVSPVQFLRTSYKAGPLIMLGVAALLASACGEGLRWVVQARPARARLAVGALSAGAAALLAVSAWPLSSGQAVGLQSSGVPAAWRDAASDLDRQLPANSRAIVLPGQLFSFYSWGGTVDPILPVLSSRPVAQRSITPWADLHATDLLWTIDRLVEQQRLYPGQLRPLLSLIGAGAVLTGSDDDRLRSGSVDPSVAATELAGQGLARPAHAYGPVRTFPAPADDFYPATALPEVRRYDLPVSRGVVSVQSTVDPLLVDGSADALAGLAAFGALAPDRPILYAGDLSSAQVRASAQAGAEVVISDSNRRRVFVNSRPEQDLGPTVGAADSFSADAAVLDPFPARGSAAQTVQVLSGARYIRAPYSPGFSQFPEHRPFAAFDGSPGTAWIADRALDPSRRWIEIGFSSRRDVPYIDLLPENDSRGTVLAVEVAGRRLGVRPGWNHLVLGLRDVSSLRVRIASVRIPSRVPGGAGGLREVRVPGVQVSESLRVPQLAQRALAGADLQRTSLTYLFARTTGDDPLSRMRGHGAWQAGSARDGGDAETGLRRRLAPPAARSWNAEAWVSLSPLTPDSTLDRLAGYRGTVAADSSGRFLDQGRFRASSVFDGVGSTAWVGELEPQSQPWISWRVPRTVTLRRLRLAAPPLAVRVPARVTLSVDGRAPIALALRSDGSLRLPSPESGTRFRLTILNTRLPPGVPAARRAVGIGEIEGAGVPRMRVPRSGSLRARCGIVSFAVGARWVPMRVDASVRTLDSGGALAARQCSPAVALPAGSQLLSAGSGVFRIDWLALRSPAPVAPPADGAGGRVLDAGKLRGTSVTGVRVALRGPAWLVLGESYDRGWRASCNGRTLGSPVVIDGYANGWRAPRGCQTVSFRFAPQQIMVWLYVLSAVAVVVLLALLRRRHAPRSPDHPDAAGAPLPAPARPPRMPASRAAALGLAAGVVLGFIFSIRSGVLIAPAVALMLWRGIGTRVLTLTAGLLLVLAVPAIYLSEPYRNLGGYDFNYAIDLIDAHWVAVGAVVLLLVALARTLADAGVARGSKGRAR